MPSKTKTKKGTFGAPTDEYSDWKKRLERTKRIWKDHRLLVQKFYDAYEGFFADQSSHPSYLSVPLIFANVKTTIPNLMVKDPYFRVSARTPFTPDTAGPTFVLAQGQAAPVRDNVLGAEVLENALNYEVRQMNFKTQAKRAVLDALFCYGVLKVGYHTEFTYDQSSGEKDKLKSKIEGEDPRESLEWNSNIKRESVWAQRVSPWDFHYDPDIQSVDTELSQAQWVAFRVVRCVDEVKADPIYSNTSDLEGTALPDDLEQVSKRQEERSGPNERYAVLWEIWDKKSRTIYVMAEGHYKFLRREPWPYDMLEFPCAFLHFNDIPEFGRPFGSRVSSERIRGPFPIPAVHLSWHLNHYINVAESMAFESMIRRVDKIAVEQGNIDAAELVALTKPLVKAFVTVKNIAGIREIKSSQPNGEDSAVSQRMLNWFYQAEGVPANARGATTGVTATETGQVQTSYRERLEEELSRVEDWCLSVGRKLTSLMKQFFDRKRIVPVLGRENFEWIPYTKENIQGEYDLDIELLGFNPTRKEVAVKQLTDLLALLSKFPRLPDGQGNQVGVNIARIVEALVAEMPIRLNTREIFGPPIPEEPAAQPGGIPGGGNGSGPPLPGQGAGSNGRSLVASQGAAASALQANTAQGAPTSRGILAGAATPSRGY